jgi:hypothetical protein
MQPFVVVASLLFVAPAAPAQPAHTHPGEETGPTWTPPIVHTLALFTVMRTTEAVIWPHPFAETRSFGDHYREAFTKPPIFDTSRRAFEWDGDRWPINVIGHGLLGSELYMRARTCDFGWAGSLAFAAGSTVVWEYLFEGNGVRPSALDLVYTPLSGLVLGEGRYYLWRAADDLADRTWRGIVKAIVDPLGELERATVSGC